MNELIEAMKRLFATNFQYAVKAQGFHVNVVGPDFHQYHELFAMVYEDAQAAIDSIAEQIRAIEGIAPFAMKRITDLGTIKDSAERPDAIAMCKELLADTQKVVNHYEECHDIAEKMRVYGLINFLEGRMDHHAKLMWMLRSTTEK